MKNGLGRDVNAGLHLPWRAVPGKPLAQFMEAISTSSIHRLRAGRWRDESNLFDFHELRQGRFAVPPIREMKNGLGCDFTETVLCLAGQTSV